MSAEERAPGIGIVGSAENAGEKREFLAEEMMHLP